MAISISYNTVFKKGATAIANIVSINGVSLSRSQIDVTHLTSADKFKEYIPGLMEGGQVDLELIFDPAHATHSQILVDFVAGTVSTYSITWPGAQVWSASMFVMSVSPSAEAAGDDKLKCNATFKVTGQWSFT